MWESVAEPRRRNVKCHLDATKSLQNRPGHCLGVTTKSGMRSKFAVFGQRRLQVVPAHLLAHLFTNFTSVICFVPAAFRTGS